MANKCGSIWDYTEIANTNQRVYTKTDVYHLQLVNETGFEITVIDRMIGTINIPSGKTRVFPAHPMYPIDQINLVVEFNAAAPPTDFLTIITTSEYGNTQKCNNKEN